MPEEKKVQAEPEPRHLTVEPYDDDERETPPDWYEGDTQ